MRSLFNFPSIAPFNLSIRYLKHGIVPCNYLQSTTFASFPFNTQYINTRTYLYLLSWSNLPLWCTSSKYIWMRLMSCVISSFIKSINERSGYNPIFISSVKVPTGPPSNDVILNQQHNNPPDDLSFSMHSTSYASQSTVKLTDTNPVYFSRAR